METEKIVRVPGRVGLERPRDPREKNYIDTHLDEITEFSLPNGQHHFEFQADEFFTRKDAAKALLATLEAQLADLGRRRVNANMDAPRNEEEIGKLVDAAIGEIEEKFLAKIKEIFQADGPYKKVSFSESRWVRDQVDKKALQDIRERLLKAADGNEILLLILSRARPELVGEAFSRISEALIQAPTTRPPDWLTVEEIEREERKLQNQAREYLEERINEARALIKK